MRFDEWWNNYISEGGKTHFNVLANEESARAAWGAIEADLRHQIKELETARTMIQGALGNGANEDLWQPGTLWYMAAIRAIQHYENHLQC